MNLITITYTCNVEVWHVQTHKHTHQPESSMALSWSTLTSLGRSGRRSPVRRLLVWRPVPLLAAPACCKSKASLSWGIEQVQTGGWDLSDSAEETQTDDSPELEAMRPMNWGWSIPLQIFGTFNFVWQPTCRLVDSIGPSLSMDSMCRVIKASSLWLEKASSILVIWSSSLSCVMSIWVIRSSSLASAAPRMVARHMQSRTRQNAGQNRTRKAVGREAPSALDIVMYYRFKVIPAGSAGITEVRSFF